MPSHNALQPSLSHLLLTSWHFPGQGKSLKEKTVQHTFIWFICFKRDVKRKVVFLPGSKELDQSDAQDRQKAIYRTECTVTWRQHTTDAFTCIFINSPRPQNCKSFATRRSFSETTPLRRTPQVRLSARLNVLYKKIKIKNENTTHSASRHQGRSNFSLLFHQKKEEIHKHSPNTHTHTHTHSHTSFPEGFFAKPCLNSPITMTTTLSLPAVPVGGFRPAFSNFTLCGYLHSVITIPSILIFPVQTMCPGYTHTHTHKYISCLLYTH